MGKRKWVVKYESEPVPHKTVRAKVRQILRALTEPEPKYSTGKFWTD